MDDVAVPLAEGADPVGVAVEVVGAPAVVAGGNFSSPAVMMNVKVLKLLVGTSTVWVKTLLGTGPWLPLMAEHQSGTGVVGEPGNVLTIVSTP